MGGTAGSKLLSRKQLGLPELWQKDCGGESGERKGENAEK